MIMLHMKECGTLSSSGAAGRHCCGGQATTSLQMEDTSGVHFTSEFEDCMFHWQSQFCEIDIADHTNIHRMLDALQADDVILQTDSIILAAADPTIPNIDSVQPSTCLTVPQVMMNSDAACNIPMVVSSELVGMPEMATATHQQAAQAAGAVPSPLTDSDVVVSIHSRPVIAIPASSGDRTSPPPVAAATFTPPSVPTPVSSDIRCRREFSVAPDNVNDVSECRPDPKVAPKPKRTSRARASPPAKKPKVIKEAPVRVNLHPKEVRSPTQTDHIIRERQRRDDMAAKYNVLEALLPPANKRERAAVVEDARELVKNLQHRKTELLKRRSHMQLTTSTRGQRAGLPGGSIRRDLKMNATGGVNNSVPTATVRVHHPQQQSVQEISGSPVSSSMASPALECIMKPAMMDHRQVDAATRYKNLSSSSNIDHSDSKVGTKPAAATCIKALHINARHVSEEGEEEVVVEMVCSWCQPNFHSLLIQTVESLRFEVIGCNICRLPATGFVQCMITAKPQIGQHKNAEIPPSSRMIGALRSAFDP